MLLKLFEGEIAHFLDETAINNFLGEGDLSFFDMISCGGHSFELGSPREKPQLCFQDDAMKDFYGAHRGPSDVTLPQQQCLDEPRIERVESVAAPSFDYRRPPDNHLLITSRFHTSAPTTFSDTDSGIHSPGSTPVKNSPTSSAFDLDCDVSNTARDWNPCGCQVGLPGSRSAGRHVAAQEVGKCVLLQMRGGLHRG